MKIFLASGNTKKILEMQRILAEHVPGIEVLGIADVEGYVEPVEDQPTFEGNALLKARAGVAATGLPSVADDSGLCVDALNGMPGVLSARWSGRHGDDPANTALLLGQLSDVPDVRRGAAFVCALALAVPDGRVEVVRGEWRGRIGRQVRGTNGFGYDPVFIPAESDQAGDDRTSAELSPAEKDALSHRGRAIRLMLPVLRELLDRS